ncbi:MAG: hypothetical protein HQL59_02310 [Magnetococcales bacterium]|nr:hypothetical protein [Magnetococcales bacterium]
MATLVGVGAVMGIGSAVAGIKGSKHDLGSGGASQYAGTAGTGEVCVFCHTPHGANVNAKAPLWNKSLPNAGSYTRYSSLGTSTLDGAEVAVGSVSLACLSCHDGSQAMDVMVNAPGSGGYNASGASAFTLAAMTGSVLPNLGTDLSNDHPISIQYAGGGLTSAQADGTYTNTNFDDKDFKTVQKATFNGTPVWWVDNGDTVRQKTEMMLYTRTVGATTEPYVECASCHDPHNEVAQPVSFLRISNANSAVCLACHAK